MKKITKILVLTAAMVLGCTGQAWAVSTTYYSKCTVSVASGSGSVYVGTSSTTKGTSTSATNSASSTGSSASTTYYIWADAGAGYYFSSWAGNNATVNNTSSANTSATITAKSSENASPTTGSCSATFSPVGVSGASGVTINVTDPDAEYTGTVSFTTSHADATNDFKTPAFSGGAGGTFAVSSWAYASDAVSVNYSYKPGSYLTGTKTLTLTSAGGEKSGTSTFTITRPDIVVSGGDAGAQLTPSTPTIDASGSCTFDVQYTNGASEFTAAFSNATSGTWTVSSIDYAKGTDGKGTITVNYTFNAGGATGDHSADLTLTANTAGGASYKVTPTAYTEAVKDYDAEVFKADGTSLKQGTWATCLSVANTAANAGCTLQLARDVTGLTATQTISNTFTLDLNGKTLSGAVNGSLLNTSTASKTLTIKDSKNGGTIKNEASYNGTVHALYLTKGLVVLESGTLSVNNTLQYNSNASTTKSMQARTVEQAANTTFTQKGGRIEAYGTRNVYGIVQNSNSSNATKTNLNGGEIYAEGPYNVFGVYAYGQLNVTDGMTINSHVNTNMVDAKYAADNANNTNNGYAYGIYMDISSNRTASSCYYGTLNMTGGTLNVTNDRTKASSLYAYGVYFNATSTGLGAATAQDGSMANQAASMGTIDGATINVTTGTYYGYGVMVYGSYNSKTNAHHVVSVQNSTINVKAHTYTYGVLSNVSISGSTAAKLYGDVELTNNTITAESTVGSTAYGVYVASTSNTIYADGSYKAYAGEYAVGAKMTVNSGTYLAKTKTSNAYGACTSTRSRTTYGIEHQGDSTRTLGGNVEAYAELIIHGGKFRGETTTGTARGLSNGGNVTIDGGEFEAYATTTTAEGIYGLSGKITATGATISASATSTSYGVMSEGSYPTGNQSQTGFTYAGDIELNNCNVTAETRTGATCAAAYVHGNASMYHWAQFVKDSTSNKWTVSNAKVYRRMFRCAQVGHDTVGVAAIGRLTINGGTYTATSATTTAYGVWSDNNPVATPGDTVAHSYLNLKNATITCSTNNGANSYAVYAGGKADIDGCTLTSSANTTTSYGVLCYDDTVHVSNTKITAIAATGTAAGLYATGVLASNGVKRQAHLIADEGNDVLAQVTGGNTAYGLGVSRPDAANYSTVYYKGDLATRATAVVNGGTYTAKASGTTAYGLFMNTTTTKNTVTASPHCFVNGGKFKATASSTVADVNANAPVDSLILNGGLYSLATNLNKYKSDEVTIWTLTDGTKYDAGYRYEIAPNRPLGVSACRIGSIYFYTLENALTYAQQNSGSSHTIIMVSDYVLPQGNYTLPSNATLLIPWKAGQTAAQGSSVERENNNNVSIKSISALYRKLTFASGVHLTVDGTIEVGGIQNSYNNVGTGVPIRAYGQLQMDEGSDITLNSTARLMAWGYITGQGTIDARRGSYCYEMFQIYDFKGGSFMMFGLSKAKSNKVFPVNQYYIQNIEVPVKFHPGSRELTCMAAIGLTQDGVGIVGTHGETAMFLMDENDDSEDTWVRKSYDPVNDRQIYEVNSAAQISSMDISVSGYSINSKDYILPITNNMTIKLLTGTLEVTQDVEFLPGSRLEVAKEASANIQSGKVLYFYDSNEWGKYACGGSGTLGNRVNFSPSWAKDGVCPRSVASKDAIGDAVMDIQGTFEVNGALYTTTSGADIFSTNDAAGTFKYNTAAPTSSKTLYQITGISSGSPTFENQTAYPAYLHNGSGVSPEYVQTSGVSAGTSYGYSDNRWRNWVTVGCFAVDKTDQSNWIYYAKPGDYVALSSGSEDGNHLYHSADLSRTFIVMDDCQWWEVKQTEEDDAVYYCADNDTYYYYDGSKWTEKVITVTWQNWDGSAVAVYDNVHFGGKPKYLGTNPKRTMDNYYTYSFVGWLPEITDETKIYENTTYIANYSQQDRLFQITFKNSDGTTIETDFYGWGKTPVCEKEPSKAGYTLSWSPALGTVSGAQEYTAVWTENTVDPTTLTYSVTFKNYDGTTLQTNTNVAYGVTPEYTGATPTKDPLNDVNYVFTGWSPNVVPVTGNAVYTAAFTTQARKYSITFKNQDGSVIETQSLGYGEVPVCQNPPQQASTIEYYYVAKWDKQITAVIADATYTCTGFTAYKNSCRLTVAAGENGSVTLDDASDPLTNLYEYGSTATIRATPDENYHFAQWSDGNTDNPRTVTVNQTTSLTAQFAKEQVTITWLNYDGSKLATSQVEYGAVPTYSGATPNKPNGCGVFYTFSSWDPVPEAATAATSYTAQFEEKQNASLISYQVAFNANGGSGSMSNQNFTGGVAQNLRANSFVGPEGTTQITYDPNYTGATSTTETIRQVFNGWKDASNNSYADKASFQDLSATCDAVVTLYAQWTAGQLVLAEAPTRAGYDFDGWYDAATGGNKVGDAGATSASTLTKFYAHWTPRTDTQYKEETYINGFSEDSYSATTTITKEGTTDATISTSTTQDMTGFTKTVAETSSSTINGDGSSVVVYRYVRNKYAITWKIDDETTYEPSSTDEFTSGDTYYQAPIVQPTTNPTKPGYTFVKWDVVSSAAPARAAARKAAAEDLPTTVPANPVTFSAVWNANTYYVSFDKNGGSGNDMAKQTFTYGASQTLSANTYTGPSYTVTFNSNGGPTVSSQSTTRPFTGWSDGNGETYTDQQPVKNLTATNGATITLTAQWGSGTITLPTPATCTGYSFLGWYNGTTRVGGSGSTYTVTADVALTGKWQVSLDAYIPGGSVTQVTPEDFQNTTRKDYPNALAVTQSQEAYNSLTDAQKVNVILDDNNQKTCASFVVTDKKDYALPSTMTSFLAKEVTYTRTIYYGYNSLTLPFDLTQADFTSAGISDVMFLTVDRYDEDANTMILTDITETGVAGGTPILLWSPGSDATWSFSRSSSEGIKIVGTIAEPGNSTAQMLGIYLNRTINTDGSYYGIDASGTALTKIPDGASQRPFRGYIHIPGTQNVTPRISVDPHPYVPTNVVQTSAAEPARKVLIDSRVYIIRGNHMFDANGRLLK